MDITLERPRNRGQWLQIYGLYLTAFPAAERKPFAVINKMYRQGRADVWRILRNGKFAGFAATVNGGEMILLDYLAVSKSCRGESVGSGAMGLLMAEYADKGLFVEIESTRCAGPEQERRKRFYLAAGLEDLGVSARVFGVDMDLLGIRCHLDFEGYRAFYRDHYSPWAAEHIESMEPGNPEKKEV